MTQDARNETPAHVARSATTQADIDLRETTLLGVFGSDAARQALIRLPDGQVARIARGTRIGRAEVVSLAPDRIALVADGRARWLEMPGR